MKKIPFLFSLAVSLLLSIPQQVSAITNISSVNGTVCNPLLSSDIQFLEKRAIGLVNVSLTKDIYIVCPGISIAETTDLPRVYGVVIGISNNGQADRTATCAVREVHASGVVLFTRAKSFDIPAAKHGATSIANYDGFAGISNAATIVCLLPRNTQMNTINFLTAE